MQLKSFTLSKLHAKVFKSNTKLWQKYEVKSIRTLSLLFGVGLGLTFLIAACSPNSTNNAGNNQTSPPNEPANSSPSSKLTNSSTVIRIGYQKAATVLYALKAKGELEKSLQKSGVSVTWTEFPAGPPMLEALNAGSIDFGYTGEAPPVFAQAAGTPLLYVAYDPLATKAEAIIVHKDSPIKSVADLKGKKVAFAKGSNTNYLIVKALEKVGLKYSDIKPTFLLPADARIAFEGKNVDAWAIWDPFLAAAQKATDARILTDATGLAPNLGYYLAAKSFVDKNPEGLETVLRDVDQVSKWAKNNPSDVAKLLSPVLGIDVGVLEISERRRDYGVLPLTEEVIDNQQKVADTFYQLKLIPKQINVRDVVTKIDF